MRKQRWRIALSAAAFVAMLAGVAAAEVVTERSASILVFPKVIADGTRDTVIQITNTSNSMVQAHCFYVNGALLDPDRPLGPDNRPMCTEIDFDIWLTKQQPTYWLVSEGRQVDPTDPTCSRGSDPNSTNCPNAGLDPGRVPPVVEDFQGELKCVQVDASGAPLSGNHLKGEATLISKDVCLVGPGECYLSGQGCSDDGGCDSERFDVAKYNALGVIGNENNNGDGVLCLGGDASADCPTGAEYNACPQTWILNHMASGASNPALDPNSEVWTGITIVPCEENFETQEPTRMTVQFLITNEYEQPFSASTTVECWAELGMSQINQVFLASSVGSRFLQTRMRPSSGTASGFMVVSSEGHMSGEGEWAHAAANLHVEGERSSGDRIVIPSEQVE